ncbi:acylneuraminate cytidylyltransferase family protein [Peredibacter starrii]|uniref:Acylneuraminate cytidylyltransferase family protein n=1 Tax=Peredibacter starrii TaxID=28202 RepID=A0AAX4HS38_9BACT|nr:acylneuraminate cytidylyltransferase family protein [Peredibacter starrii]WPU65820.1 acylneuraminate cytidylyltransferase family protein [Peredibacter starrii]
MITVFLPCRSGSERVKNKNIRTFAGVEGGLTRIKIEQLLKISQIQRIVLSTNDEEVMKIAESFNDRKIQIDRRPQHLALSSTSTDELIDYVGKIITEGDILWTHVTSPFVSAETYSRAIKKYYEVTNEGYDSLMSVSKIQTFLWSSEGAFNYDPLIEKWPRTQTLRPLYEVNSAFFMANHLTYISLKNRIGQKPYLLETSKIENIDIDWEEDFQFAEQVWRTR